MIISLVRKISVKCLYLGGDGLLHIGVCSNSLGSQLLLKGFKDVEINGCKIKNVGKVVHNLPALEP
jgi:hypothetical protein